MAGSRAIRSYKISVGEACDRGLTREENQDTVLQATTGLGHLLLVADGIGGYSGGAVASRMVAEAFHRHLEATARDVRLDTAMREASDKANAEVRGAAHAADSAHAHMGSTLVAALLRHDENGVTAWVGHVGDSRAYLFRDGRLSKITTDHSAVQMLLSQNLITPEQALNHPDASVLTRCIGHDEHVEMDIDVVALAAGDLLLLCSDGLWGFTNDEEIQAVLVRTGAQVESAAQALLELALAGGGGDNIGIELARVEEIRAPLAEAPGRRWTAIALIALALVAGLGALAYWAWAHHWLLNRGH